MLNQYQPFGGDVNAQNLFKYNSLVPGMLGNTGMMSRQNTMYKELLNRMNFNQQNQQQPAMPQADPKALQAQYNRLASQASNALNGGLLGYQPSEIRAAGTNPQTFTGPSNSFRFPFGLLNGMGG